MNQEKIKTLMDRWTADAEFRRELRANPEDAVRKAGVELDAEERAALRAVDWKLSDQELKQRASKLFV
ncbi:MAG: hypothetical protein HY552_05150 [Elusimicrobia bacterium]|nr:hypothetical protein [Elusimicrobiota bacterium]